jgi:hypothetical protein
VIDIAVADAVKMGTPDVTPVVQAYDHALFAMYPQRYYCVGPLNAFFKLLAALPEFVNDIVATKASPCVPEAAKK